MDITIRNLQTKVPIRVPRVNRAARQALLHFDIQNAMIAVVFVAPGRMKTLNAKYLKHNYVTDVLTFDYTRKESIKDSSVLVGEIVICPSVAMQNARDFKTTVHREIDLYVIHGILHLKGYDDHSSRDIVRMKAKEEEILKLL